MASAPPPTQTQAAAGYINLLRQMHAEALGGVTRLGPTQRMLQANYAAPEAPPVGGQDVVNDSSVSEVPVMSPTGGRNLGMGERAGLWLEEKGILPEGSFDRYLGRRAEEQAQGAEERAAFEEYTGRDPEKSDTTNLYDAWRRGKVLDAPIPGAAPDVGTPRDALVGVLSPAIPGAASAGVSQALRVGQPQPQRPGSRTPPRGEGPPALRALQRRQRARMLSDDEVNRIIDERIGPKAETDVAVARRQLQEGRAAGQRGMDQGELFHSTLEAFTARARNWEDGPNKTRVGRMPDGSRAVVYGNNEAIAVVGPSGVISDISATKPGSLAAGRLLKALKAIHEAEGGSLKLPSAEVISEQGQQAALKATKREE